MAQTMNKKLTTERGNETYTARQTALWIIGLMVVTVFCFYTAYTSATSETYEQCIAGDRGHGGTECYEYETRPGPDWQMASVMSFMGIVSLGYTVALIWKAFGNPETFYQRPGGGAAPWWAFWR
jgi:hypothetical protein